MNDDKGQNSDKGKPGYETPGEDTILKSHSDAVPSPSETSKHRLQAPDSYIGGEVNETPGDSNPALNETIGYESGQTSTADFLRAREAAEERDARAAGKEIYADQVNYARPGIGISGDPEEEIYGRREFSEPDESDEIHEIDTMAMGGPDSPQEEDNDH